MNLVPLAEVGLRSFIGVPLIFKDAVLGVLYMCSAVPNLYTDQDVALATRVGTQIAGAISNSELHAELRQAESELRDREGRIRELVASATRAHEEERQWAAAEVHDRIGQPLAGALQNLSAIESDVEDYSQAKILAQEAMTSVQAAFAVPKLRFSLP